MTDPIIVVGASQAGLQVAESLRADGYDGPLVMIGEETHPPYQRPPLSKAPTGETARTAWCCAGATCSPSATSSRRRVRVEAIDRAGAACISPTVATSPGAASRS
jgi:3-phenylpropionate/trans-cinnamate dioxygenase ferredoxin reductase subunit